jgi:hypothetical protein
MKKMPAQSYFSPLHTVRIRLKERLWRPSLLVLFFTFLIIAQLFVFSSSAFAANSPFPILNPASLAATVDPAVTPAPQDGTWVSDSDVTFVGKVGARAGDLLDWTLQNYNWSFVSNGQNPLTSFWATIRNIVYAFIAIFVLITAFVLIVTRGRNITVMRFIPRFILIVLLVTFSFALAQFLYQIVDIVQGFFLKNPDPITFAQHSLISRQNLLNISFDYKSFAGYRFYGSQFDESAFISLLLVKLTAITYYVMSGILLLRKIILWFFIIISPIFPLLLLYSPIRNTGKIWIGEFFRWLLYAPIFAILLSGLVNIWMLGIPLKFNFSNDVTYQPAINILLGGPGQTLSLVNSVSNKDSFAQYIVALLMLWVVIILPFLLLQIFLNYINTISIGENVWMKQLATTGSSFMGRGKNAGPEPQPPLSSQPAGMARSIPFTAKIEIPEVKTQNIASSMFSHTSSQMSSQVANLHSVQSSSEILRLTNLTVPTMRDIARYETSAISSDISRHSEIARVHETLERIANPSVTSTPTEKQRYTTVKEKLVQEGQKGNYLANTILSAAQTASASASTSSSTISSYATSASTSIIDKQQEIVRLGNALERIENPDIAGPIEKQKYIVIKQQLFEAEKSGDPVASLVLTASKKGKLGSNDEVKEKLKEAKEKGNSLAATVLQEAGLADVKKAVVSNFPIVNRVQSVNLDDYEAVKKMWVENYQKLEPPKAVDGKEINRKQWVMSDINKITETINLLVSADPQNVKKGMESVGTILPFLLIGGFSQTEVIAYLKAKLEAAKAIVTESSGKEEEESTALDKKETTEEKPKEMSAHEELEDTEEGKKDSN